MADESNERTHAVLIGGDLRQVGGGVIESNSHSGQQYVLEFVVVDVWSFESNLMQIHFKT